MEFSQFSPTLSRVIWFYLFAFLNRRMKIIAVIPGLQSLYAACRVLQHIFCASAFGVLSACLSEQVKRSLHNVAFPDHPDMLHKAAQLFLISILVHDKCSDDEEPINLTKLHSLHIYMIFNEYFVSILRKKKSPTLTN